MLTKEEQEIEDINIDASVFKDILIDKAKNKFGDERALKMLVKFFFLINANNNNNFNNELYKNFNVEVKEIMAIKGLINSVLIEDINVGKESYYFVGLQEKLLQVKTCFEQQISEGSSPHFQSTEYEKGWKLITNDWLEEAYSKPNYEEAVKFIKTYPESIDLLYMYKIKDLKPEEVQRLKNFFTCKEVITEIIEDTFEGTEGTTNHDIESSGQIPSHFMGAS